MAAPCHTAISSRYELLIIESVLIDNVEREREEFKTTEFYLSMPDDKDDAAHQKYIIFQVVEESIMLVKKDIDDQFIITKFYVV